MPKNIFDVGHKVIDTVEEAVHTGSNAVDGVNKDIEDQTGQDNFDWNSALEYCGDQENPIECIRDNLFKTGIHSKPVNEVINWNHIEKKTEIFFMKIYGKACVRDNQCSVTSYCSICKYFKILLFSF